MKFYNFVISFFLNLKVFIVESSNVCAFKIIKVGQFFLSATRHIENVLNIFLLRCNLSSNIKSKLILVIIHLCFILSIRCIFFEPSSMVLCEGSFIGKIILANPRKENEWYFNSEYIAYVKSKNAEMMAARESMHNDLKKLDLPAVPAGTKKPELPISQPNEESKKPSNLPVSLSEDVISVKQMIKNYVALIKSTPLPDKNLSKIILEVFPKKNNPIFQDQNQLDLFSNELLNFCVTNRKKNVINYYEHLTSVWTLYTATMLTTNMTQDELETYITNFCTSDMYAEHFNRIKSNVLLPMYTGEKRLFQNN